MSLNFRPDIEERLRVLADARGVSIDSFLEHVVEEKGGAAATPRLSAEEWGHRLEHRRILDRLPFLQAIALRRL